MRGVQARQISALGLVVLALGNRLVLHGAGIGVLLGPGMLRWLPGSQASLLGWIVPISLVILFGLGDGSGQGGIFDNYPGAWGAGWRGNYACGVGFVWIDLGWVNWILTLIGAVIGVGLMSCFEDWAVIILAAVIGALLTVRGIQMLIPSFPVFLPL